MEFLKKHYEKLILSLVLLGLAVAVAALPIKVSQEKENEERRKADLIGAPVKPFAAVDLSTNKTILEKVKNPITFEISGKHNLFNPVPWEKRPNGELVKLKTGNETGISALKVTGTRPLQLIIKLDDVSGTDTNNLKYTISVIRETEKPAKASRAFSLGQTTPIGTLKEVRGSLTDPSEIIFTLPDRRQVSVTKEKPHTEIIGYAADLVYPLTGWALKDARKDQSFQLANDTYKIVAIDKDVVRFSAKSNQKQSVKKVE
jgi:hypothetical protein